MSLQKNELRENLKKARLSLSDSEYVNCSRAIVRNLKNACDWASIASLHYYEPIKAALEPDIGEHIRYLVDNYPKISLTTTRLINNEWRMVMAKGKEIPDEFDVILVPMLGFDPSLNRIGYGSGYYDRFLATQRKAKTIGVNFEVGKVKKIIPEAHDVILSAVVTESGIYYRKNK